MNKNIIIKNPEGLAAASPGRTGARPSILFLLALLFPTVLSAATFTVNSTGDAADATPGNGICETATGNGVCTLRAAIGEANALAGTDTITFSSLFNTPQTITLGGTQLTIAAALTILGPGANLLTVSGNNASRVFNVDDSTAAQIVVTLDGLTISGGRDTSGGGGILNIESLTIRNSTISGNDGTNFASGGGVLSGSSVASSTLTISNSTISGGNTAAFGGGVVCGGSTCIITNSTISGNTAGGQVGGLNAFGTTLTVTNSTISGNMAPNGVGGVFIQPGTAAAISNSTITNNRADSDGNGSAAGGGGILNQGSTTLTSTIVAGNFRTGSNADDISGAVTSSSSFNLIGDTATSGGLVNGVNNNIVGSNPMLGPLQNNGGPTFTHALLPGSPAIDRGSNPLNLTTDQRGAPFVRAGGAGADIGAFEVQAPAPTPTPTPTPTPAPTTLGNISTRLRVGTDDNVLIGGFIITGTQPKKVLLRAIGPSLPLAGVLADPTLELHDGAGTLLATNDNWMDASNKQEIIDSTIAPTNDLESAILATLDPGLYTAIMRGVNNSTGIGLVEAYDLDSTADSELANISTRGFVQTGDDVMIGGFILVGPGAEEVLVRAIGPSLPLAGALADPTLELFDGNGMLLASNDDWRDTQEAEITATMIPPSDDAESAILQTLAPAAYTAIVRGVNNTTGVALVEAYALTP